MEDTVKILNLKQAAFYIINGVQPLSVRVNKREKLIFEFPIDETQQLYLKWIEKCYGSDIC